MLEYKAIELHCHTINSDGKMTVEELLNNAVTEGYDAVAITDHNTLSGHRSLFRELMQQTVPVIKGIEWTTFFGHMVVLGAKKFIDWRFALPDNIDNFIKDIKKFNGTVGVAHPFVMGSPMCTGCAWKFDVKNWNNVNYIEVWSRAQPMFSHHNIKAFNMWTDLLNKGFRIAASSGRDWHYMPELNDEKGGRFAITYLGLKKQDSIAEEALDAIKRGCMYVTCGPTISLAIDCNAKAYEIGDEISSNDILRFEVSIDDFTRIPLWEKLPVKTTEIRLVNNGNIVKAITQTNTNFSTKLSKGWARIEWYGEYDSKANTLLGFTSPIYLV